MVLDRRQILETSLFDLEQIVTLQYLSRHADLSIDNAKNELTGFLKENRNRSTLHAVYVVSGELNAPGPANSSTTGNAAVIRKFHRTQLVRDCDLERIRQAYRKLETCEIYCLHTKPIKSLCLLYSVDSLEDRDYERTDPERSWLSYPEAETKKKEMLAQYGETSMLDTQKKKVQKDLMLSMSKSSESTSKMTKGNRTSLSMQPAVQNEQEKAPSMKSISQNEEINTDKKVNVASREARKRRGQRVFIDSKEQDMNDETGSRKNTGIKNMSKSIEITALDARPTLLTQDDLFSDGNADADMINCESVKVEIVEEKRNTKKMPQFSKEKNLENESCENQKKAVRKEYVTETFLDADGFMVTKQVLKEIELESPSTNSIEMHAETTNVSAVNSKKRRGPKIPQGQAKISSFFQKR